MERDEERDYNVIIVDKKRDYPDLTNELPNLTTPNARHCHFNIFEEKKGHKDAVHVVADENYFWQQEDLSLKVGSPMLENNGLSW